MPIPFHCHQCGATGKAGSKFAGQTIHCPKCQAKVRVPTSIEEGTVVKTAPAVMATGPAPASVEPPPLSIRATTPPPSPAPPVVVKEEAPEPLPIRSHRWPYVCAGLALVVWLATLHADSPWGALAHYAATIGAIFLVGLGVAHARHSPWIAWAGLVAGIVAAVAWGRFDYSKRAWTRTGDNGIESHFVDWTYRGHDLPFYRELGYDDGFGSHTLKVSFSESGKPHGPSIHHVFFPKNQAALKAAGFDVDQWGIEANKNEWFWYGERINEGEWHLRNR